MIVFVILGQCDCHPGTQGLTCDSCQPQYYGFSNKGCQSKFYTHICKSRLCFYVSATLGVMKRSWAASARLFVW